MTKSRKKTWLKRGVITLVIIGIILWLLPMILKPILEGKISDAVNGELTLDDIDVNLFNGKFSVDSLVLFDQNHQTVIACAEIRMNTNISKLIFSNTLHISSLQLSSPEVYIEIEDSAMNLQRLLKPVEVDSTSTSEEEEAMRILVDELMISQGLSSYKDESVGLDVVIEDLEVKLHGYDSEKPDFKVETEFKHRTGGSTSLGSTIDLVNASVDGELKLDSVDLAPYLPVLREHMEYSEIGGFITSNIPFNLQAESGDLNVEDATISMSRIHLSDSVGSRIMAIPEMNVAISELNTGEHKMQLKSIELTRPLMYVQFEGESNNLSGLVAEDKAAEIDSLEVDNKEVITDSVIVDDAAFDLMIDSLVVENGSIYYKDILNRNTVDLRFDSLNTVVTNFSLIDNNASGWLETHLGDGLVRAEFGGDLIEVDSLSLDLISKGIELAQVSPYSHEYVGHRILEGKLGMTANWSIRNNHLVSENHMHITDATVSPKEKHPDITDVPLRLGISILRNTKGIIELDVPMEGDLGDPGFRLRKVIFKTLKNVLIKAAASPYSGVVHALNPDRLPTNKTIEIQRIGSVLTYDMRHSLDLMIEQLKAKSGATLTIHYMTGTAGNELTEDMLTRYASDWRINPHGSFSPLDHEMAAWWNGQPDLHKPITSAHPVTIGGKNEFRTHVLNQVKRYMSNAEVIGQCRFHESDSETSITDQVILHIE